MSYREFSRVCLQSKVSYHGFVVSTLKICCCFHFTASHVRRVRVPSQASDVDQFLDDLFSPVLENLDDLSDARSLITSIKGGNPQESTTGNNNRSNPTSPIPETTTTFLQSAFAQNLQIQQQLIAQNQALQQLLQQTLGVGESSPTPPDKKVVSERLSYSSNNSGSGGRPPPPPPPLPPSPLQGHRPFIDPYGRAKTVRIGKWRWPPKDDECGGGGDHGMAGFGGVSNNGASTDDFMAFKQRVEDARRLDTVDNGSSGGDSFVWPGDEEDDTKSSSSSENKLIGLVGGKKIARPFGGDVVGKLKLSNEMRMKLEQVTSVRLGKGSSAPKIPIDDDRSKSSQKVVKKLDESRRNVLEQKLGGGMMGGAGARDSSLVTPSSHHDGEYVKRNMGVAPPPPPMMPKMVEHGQVHGHHNLHSGRNLDSQDRVMSSKPKTPTSDYSSFEHSNVFLSSFKLKNGPRFRLRKECFMPGEEISSNFGEFLKAQVLRDVRTGNPRVLGHERGVFLNASNDGTTNPGGWKEVVEVAKTWELYFWRIYRVQVSVQGSLVASWLYCATDKCRVIGLFVFFFFVSIRRRLAT